MKFNKSSSKYLVAKKNKVDLPTIEILNFIKNYNVTIINKSEEIDENSTKFNLKIKLNNKDIMLNLKISKDSLFTSNIIFQGKENKLITRDLNKIKNILKEIFLG